MPACCAPSALSSTARLLPWPVPALVCWALCWSTLLALSRVVNLPTAPAWLLASALGLGLAWFNPRPWRRAMLAAGFPLSSLLWAGGPEMAAVWWLLPLALLALLYPRRAWRDAPWYPTSAAALRQLASTWPLPEGARVLDAGCGLGHGLRALRQQYPRARFEGTEWSAALAALTRLRCPWAQVRRGDMWADDWSAYDLVYLFQRPESMPRALAKARAEMRPGGCLVSLAFEVPGQRPLAVLRDVAERPLFVYRIEAATEGATPPTRLKSREVGADMQNKPTACAPATRAKQAPRSSRPRRKA